MNAAPATQTCPEPITSDTSAAERRERAQQLRWAARCDDMEAVLDDIAVALLPRPEIQFLVGTPCDGIDCRYEPGANLNDYNCFPHLEIDAVVVRASNGDLVREGKTVVPAAVRLADLEEDPEGHHPDSRGWQVAPPYRAVPPAKFAEDAEEEGEVWLDAAALRARVHPAHETVIR